MLNKSFTQMAIFIQSSSLREFRATCIFHFLFLGGFERYSLICNRLVEEHVDGRTQVES